MSRAPANLASALPHESGERHVTGEAVYVDDIPLPSGALVGKVVTSPFAHAKIQSFDLADARGVAGVRAVLSYADIPGDNQMGPVVKDEPCLASGEVTFIGQAVFLIAAESLEQCREAERHIKISYRELPAILDIPSAIAAKSQLGETRMMRYGNAGSALQSSPHRIEGELSTGAAEHWYLETQVCLAVPSEGREMNIYSSNQHPSEAQTLVAGVLGLPANAVTVEVRRMGGGFGGKETQANHVACWAALLAGATGKPVKIRLNRDEDMIMTGKRHPFLIRYRVGYDGDGRIQAVLLELNSDAGAATDLSHAIMERAMLHCDNAYSIPNMEIVAKVWKTNHPSNTAMRGFGGPQGMAAIETIIDRIARALKLDAADVRSRNFYGTHTGETTHYGQAIGDNRLQKMFDRIMETSAYRERRREVRAFNAGSDFKKRGIALTPVKFGISFTTTFLNQAGALVHCYADGTVLVSHGGTEMGQGLYTKISRIVSGEFGIPDEMVRIDATNTSKVPNTSATAASSGADLNGMAVKNAIDTLKSRISPATAAYFSERFPQQPTRAEAIEYSSGRIADTDHPDRSLSFAEAMAMLRQRQVSLSATGYYATPTIGWDKKEGRGKPFYYFAYGMAVSEVEVDLLTGRHVILRTDILHDAGNSINRGIDIGQVEGGFVQGVGWCTTEEIRWDTQGRLLTHSPDTYKIPTVRDIPLDFRVELLENAGNPDTIWKSKAVGEPPFMLCFSVWLAIKDAISAAGEDEFEPLFALPATNERIVMSAAALDERVKHASSIHSSSS